MPYNITFNGTVYTMPLDGDNNAWDILPNGPKQFFQAIGTAALTPASGSGSPLTALLDFGPSFGLKALYHQSETALAALAGVLRLANVDVISWRNGANSGDLQLAIGSLNQLVFNGTDVTGHPKAIYNTCATSIPTATTTVLNFTVAELDTQGAVTVGAAWKFTVPAGRDGLYVVEASAALTGVVASGGATLALYKNGVLVRNLAIAAASLATGSTLNGACTVSLVAGDFVDIRLTQGSGGTLTVSTTAATNYVCIHRTVA